MHEPMHGRACSQLHTALYRMPDQRGRLRRLLPRVRRLWCGWGVWAVRFQLPRLPWLTIRGGRLREYNLPNGVDATASTPPGATITPLARRAPARDAGIASLTDPDRGLRT